MGTRSPMTRTVASVVVGLCFVGSPSLAQFGGLSNQAQERAALQYHQRRVQSFVEDTYRFYEITGEMVSFRVHPQMTREELEQIEELSEDLDDEAGRLISFVFYLVPTVRGKTDELWIVPEMDESSTLEHRLTVILSLVNSVEPKIQQLTAILTGEREESVEVEDLMVEASLPYFIVGGLEELRSMTRELRDSL